MQFSLGKVAFQHLKVSYIFSSVSQQTVVTSMNSLKYTALATIGLRGHHLLLSDPLNGE